MRQKPGLQDNKDDDVPLPVEPPLSSISMKSSLPPPNIETTMSAILKSNKEEIGQRKEIRAREDEDSSQSEMERGGVWAVRG